MKNKTTSNTLSLNTNVCITNQRRCKGSISSVGTSEGSMESDNGDSNSVSREISPTHERTYAMNKVQNDQIPTIDDEENTIIIIDDSPDENEPVRAPIVSVFLLFLLNLNFTFYFLNLKGTNKYSHSCANCLFFYFSRYRWMYHVKSIKHNHCTQLRASPTDMIVFRL